MNRKIGMYSSMLTLAGVLGFATSMILGSNYTSYLSSVFIALGFVPMVCSFVSFQDQKSKAAGLTAIAFAIVYATLIFLVYFAQLTSVQFGNLSEEASRLLDYSKFGLLFSYDLLGYGFMSLATFFTGLIVQKSSPVNTWLRRLLMIHGVFAISCFTMPILWIFKEGMQGGAIVGILILEFWCLYFTPICLLAWQYFRKQNQI